MPFYVLRMRTRTRGSVSALTVGECCAIPENPSDSANNNKVPGPAPGERFIFVTYILLTRIWRHSLLLPQSPFDVVMVVSNNERMTCPFTLYRDTNKTVIWSGMKEWVTRLAKLTYFVLTSTIVALIPSKRTIIVPSNLNFVVNREQAVAEQEAQVPAYVRKQVLQTKLPRLRPRSSYFVTSEFLYRRVVDDVLFLSVIPIAAIPHVKCYRISFESHDIF